MEAVDRATNYDSTSCLVLLGHREQTDNSLSLLSEEQNRLLYGTGRPKGASGVGGASKPETPSSPWTPSLPPYRKGLGERNIVSARIAWAKLRLAERREGTGGEVRPPAGAPDANRVGRRRRPSKDIGSGTSEWYNENKAGHDEALALISEGTQVYIRRILRGAIGAARQRLNLDGMRLWHQQHAAVAAKAASIGGRVGRSPLLPVGVGVGSSVVGGMGAGTNGR